MGGVHYHHPGQHAFGAGIHAVAARLHDGPSHLVGPLRANGARKEDRKQEQGKERRKGSEAL